MEVGPTSEDCEFSPFDDEQMMAILCSSLSPPRALPPCLPWSPTEFFERMPPSPPAPVGFLMPSNLDDEYMLPVQIDPCPRQADLAAATLVDKPGTSYGGNTESPMEKPKLAKNKWEFPLPLPEHRICSSSLDRERFDQALSCLMESSDERHLLTQVWVPAILGGRYVLTNSEQPFFIRIQNIGVREYRALSTTYRFSIDGSNAVESWLPGRVFKQKVPEWAPEVQYYRSDDYPLCNHARCNAQAVTIALPVFDPFTESCIAVVELIMTSEMLSYGHEVNKICEALQAVNLKSTNVVDRMNVQIYNKGRQCSLDDIANLLNVICITRKLPLAQTWVPCNSRSVMSHGGSFKRSCGRCKHNVCISACDFAFYVLDTHMWGFRDACMEHLLQKGQGVPGKAFLSRRPCFSKDVTQLCKLEYPLVHYARMFGLSACLAVCIQSSHTGDDVYILEFFLPPDCQEDAEQKALLESILALVRETGRSLRVAVDGDFSPLQESEMLVNSYEELKETDAQNPGGRHCESALLLTGNENDAATMDIVQHHISGNLTNAGKSEVWHHFMKDGARAYCKRCSKDYAADSRKNGTSRLWRHLADAHSLKVPVDADFNSLQANDMRGRRVDENGFQEFKTSRTISKVWHHFVKDGTRAYCTYCSKVYEADSRKNGTSRLWRHLAGVHGISRGSCTKGGN